MNQTDENFKTQYGSFLIRVRQGSLGVLRGQIEHVQSGEKRSFANFTDVLKFIEACLEPITESEIEINEK